MSFAVLITQARRWLFGVLTIGTTLKVRNKDRLGKCHVLVVDPKVMWCGGSGIDVKRIWADVKMNRRLLQQRANRSNICIGVGAEGSPRIAVLSVGLLWRYW